MKVTTLLSDLPDKSLNEEYEFLIKKAKQFRLELEASRLRNAYNGIRYHASNPDEETRKQTIEQFNKIASELKEKIKEYEQ
jgi:hypothetical protein